MSELSILVDASTLNKEFQGTRTYIKELYCQLAIRYPEVRVYMAMFPDPTIEQEFKEISNIGFIALKRIDWLGRMMFEFPSIIRNGNFDFVHFQYTLPFLRVNNCKYIVTIHDILFNDFPDLFPWAYRLKRNTLFKYAAKNAVLLLTVSRYSKEKISQKYNVDASKIHVIPNGVNAEYFEPYQKEDQEIFVEKSYGVKNFMLYVSRVEPRKNQLLVLDEFLKQKKIDELVFIGKRTLDYTDFEARMASLTEVEKKRIHFFEQVSSEDLLHFLRAAKVFVYPSLAEGFGIPPLEAGAAGIPVLCSNLTAMQDFTFFKDHFFNPTKPGELGIKLRNLEVLGNPLKLKTIQNEIKRQYSWSRSADDLFKLLSKANP
jgi:glycosyltransferase involved in cell wall biosynthesis